MRVCLAESQNHRIVGVTYRFSEKGRKMGGLSPGWAVGFEAKALGRRRNPHLPRVQDPRTSRPSTESRT